MELELSVAALVILGCVCGVTAGFFGIGGGMVLVPCLTLLNVPMEHAIGISIMQMVFSSTFGSIINIYNKKLDIKDGVFVGLGGLIGASFSGFIVDALSSFTLLVLFLLLSCITFYKYAFNIKTTENPTPPITSPTKQKLMMILAGLITGVFAISLGIGGGLILGPLLAYYLGFNSKKFVPIALFFIIFAATSGSISLFAHNLVDVRAGLIVGIASMFGVALGTYLISIVTLKNHRYALITIYAVSILMTSWKVVLSV